MMEFLDTLFNYEYFGPILFAVIAILIVLFFIILFFGKKEEKERILEETRRLELANLNAFKEEEVDSVELEVKNEVLEENKTHNDNIEPVQIIERVEESSVEEVKLKGEMPEINEEIVVKEKEELEIPILTPVVETPLITEVKEKMELPESDFKVEPSIPTNISKYNFEELANSISKELEEIEKFSKLQQENEPVIEEQKLKIQESQIEVTPIKDIKKYKPSPVFSSVFVPGKEEIKEEQEPVKEGRVNEVTSEINKIESAQEIEMPTVFEETKIEDKTDKIDFSILKANGQSNMEVNKPKVELPKTVELPKKNNENVVGINIPDFEEIQGETYKIGR